MSPKQADFGPFDDANNYYGEQDCADVSEQATLLALVLWCLEYSTFQTLAFRSAV